MWTLGDAQVITIKDSENKKVIEGAVVSAESITMPLFTDKNGKVDITSLSDSELIEISHAGYKSIIIDFAELRQNGFVQLLQPYHFNLDEVVVSATRWRQSSGSVPAKISTISSEEVALQNPQTAADMLGISGKVYIQKSQQGGGSPMIRGFATNRLLYTIDGVRMNTAIFRGGNIQNVISLDAFAMESTEVLFGPGSVIYGSDAIGGVMSFQTLTPQLSTAEKSSISGNAVTRYSSANNEKTAHIDLNAGWNKWASVTSLSYSDYDHLRQGSHGPEDYIKPFYVDRIDGVDQVIEQENPLLQIPTAFSQWNIMQKLRYRPSDQWDLQYGLHYSETSPFGRYDRHNRLRNGQPRYAEWDYGPQIWMMNHLSATHQSVGNLYDQMTINLAQQWFKESRIDRNLGGVQRNTQTENVKAYSANVDFIKKVNDIYTLDYGLEYVKNDVTSDGEITDILTNRIDCRPFKISSGDLGVYGCLYQSSIQME